VEIAQSYDGARRAREIFARAGKTGAAMAMEDLGVQRLLLEVADVNQLRKFAHHLFGGFLDHGKGNEAEYLSTLACYFRRNSSPPAVAGDLHVHRKTVSYRIRRVEELSALGTSATTATGSWRR
jgi:DNA-binding PucR family transcriptional regulator